MKKTLKYLAIITLIAFFASCNKDDGPGGGETPPPAPPPEEDILPKKEMRAVWIATVSSIDWPKSYNAVAQKQEYINYLNKFVELNINTVFVQVRPTGDAFYNSEYEPWCRFITGTEGQDPGYDVLQFMLDEAHKRNIEFHAWLNPFRIDTRASKTASYRPLHAKIPPELVKDYDRWRIYNPALPGVHQRIADIVKDLITKYDVDGIHFDDYFYPDPAYYASTGVDDAAEYAQYGAGYATVQEFRFGNVNKVVQKLQETIAENNPGVVFSISPTSSVNYNRSLYADVEKWCKEGWIDVVIPQIYQQTGSANNEFNYFVDYWPHFSFKAVPMIGYAIYKFGVAAEIKNAPKFANASELTEQFRLAGLQSKVKGSVLYNASSVMTNNVGVTDALKNIYKYPAVRPFLGRKTLSDPKVPGNVALNGATLTWNAYGLQAVVYVTPENETKPHVVAITSASSYQVSEKGQYVVTAVNKDNTESPVSAAVTYK
ncbi:MAG: family 10 glycosylhydrolase [Prevotellaceae bacterium]|nr:family 10 glycosylhydrolase [Prevotellaceae bacterium]